MAKQEIRLAHSPDSDDAFMFYALATEKINTGEFIFTHQLDDIETLNQAASRGSYEVTAVSIHAYAYLHEQYALLNSGASMGEGYGPILVSKLKFPLEELPERRVAIPGEQTSAFLALKLFQPDFEHRVVSFDEIIPMVQQEEVDAGVVIHEGQLTYRDEGLFKLLDLGEWWEETTGLPLPLGGNVIRRDLGMPAIRQISELIHESISYAFAHKEEALAYALQFGRGLDAELGERFVNMYVNERTLDYGEDGRKAVQLLLDRGHEAGLIPHQVKVDFV
ncbi:MAG: MqnA/MqnD/SBP family protein [Acidobacteriota bacterium]|nr:MqnA/MqnD/SBP family protein [Acidobacteriota bacterium]